MAKMTILLLDDHPIVLEGMRCLLQASIGEVQVLTAREADDATNILQRRMVDVIVSDLELRQGSGMAFVKRVRANHPLCRIVIYTMHEEPWTIKDILDQDVDAVVMKGDDMQELVVAVKAVMKGEGYYSTSFCRMMSTLHSLPERLSDRERQVLEMSAQGLSISDTAEALHVTASTVEFHRRRIMQKLQVSNVAEMIRKASMLGWNAPI